MYPRRFLPALLLCVAPCVTFAQTVYFAQPPTTPQAAPMTAAEQKNVDFVLNWWREVIEARHTELAANYQAEDYIQHNPNVPTGRAAFVKFFSSLGPPSNPIPEKLTRPPVVRGAKDSLVWLIFQEEGRDPHDGLKRLYASSFDLVRMENGKVQEHWDSARKRPGSPVFVPSTAAPPSRWITSKPTPEEERNLAIATQLLKDVCQYGHVELLDGIVAPDFIQHNPTVPDGRDGLRELISHKPELAGQTIRPEWKHAPVLQFANGRYVVTMWEHKDADPSDPAWKYTRNYFEVVRIENGLIKEDWN
jgi:predicted SnoaL-like aldol condensation-catalyzing enzyme